MLYLVAGLGNPGKTYERTRHNAGRIVLEAIRKENGFPEWRAEGSGALVSRGTIEDNDVIFVLPERFMNISGTVIKKILANEKEAVLVLVYDDLDIPLGDVKLSFGRGSGGHRGVQSVIDELGTKDFFRIRVGILHKSIFGHIKKPKGEDAVENFLLSPFGKKDEQGLIEVSQSVYRALALFIRHGKDKALSLFHQDVPQK